MSNWISKATNAFKGDDSSSPQAFELFCECGQKHSGLRRAKWQRIVCRACGGSLFVLQRDPYPAPKEQPQQHSTRALLDEAVPESEVVENEYGEQAPQPAPTRREAIAGGASPKRAPSAPVAAPARIPRQSQVGFWKQFRVIFVVIGLVGGITGFVLYQSSQRAAAEISLKDSIDKTQDALGKGEWIEARNQLEIAVRSLDRLGRENADALRFRQQLRETTAMTRLLSQPLSELLVDAAEAQAAGEAELAAFQFRVKEQWIILEGQAEPLLSDKKSSRKQYRIVIPVSAGKENLPVEIVIVSTELSRLMAKSEAESVVVAIQIEAVKLSEDKSTWQIVATPESTVLWADRIMYLGIGYSAEDADSVADVLAKQAKSLGVTGEPHAL